MDGAAAGAQKETFARDTAGIRRAAGEEVG